MNPLPGDLRRSAEDPGASRDDWPDDTALVRRAQQAVYVTDDSVFATGETVLSADQLSQA